jgi:hypothetical protein
MIAKGCGFSEPSATRLVWADFANLVQQMWALEGRALDVPQRLRQRGLHFPLSRLGRVKPERSVLSLFFLLLLPTTVLAFQDVRPGHQLGLKPNVNGI